MTTAESQAVIDIHLNPKSPPEATVTFPAFTEVQQHLPLPSPGLDPTQYRPGPSITIDSEEQALQRLITRAVPRDEFPSLIETIFSGKKTDVVDRLSGSDAQAFIDIIDEVRHHTLYSRGMVDLHLFPLHSFVQALNELNLASRVRKKCLKLLYNTCARRALFPRSLRIELCDNPDGVVMYRGGFGDVSKREYHGREVAVKMLRKYTSSDPQKIIRVGR